MEKYADDDWEKRWDPIDKDYESKFKGMGMKPFDEEWNYPELIRNLKELDGLFD